MIKKTKKLINQVKKSRDGKVLASNFGFLMLLQIAGYIFPLITIPYLARVIGVDGFGKIAFATAVITWLQTVSDWGFNYTATRDLARNKNNPNKVSEIFSDVLWARLFLMLVSLALLVILITAVPYFNDSKEILLISFLLVPGHIMFPEWFFQAMERMKYISVFNVVSKALFTALVFVFINSEEDYILQPLITSLGYFVSGVGAMYLVLVKWGVELHKPNLPRILKTIKASTDVFINNLMPNLYNSFSIVLLGFFGGSTANGLLDAGNKFSNIARSFMSVIARVFFPFLSRKIDHHKVYAKGSLFTAALGTLILFLFSPVIIRFFYTEEFNGAVMVLKITAFSLIFSTLSKVYGTNYMILQGDEKRLRNITFYSSMFGLITSLPLIYYHGYIGAAINITLARGVLGISTMLASNRKIERKI